VLVWRDQAKHAVESLTKGNRVVVIGRLQQRTWTAGDGSARSVVEVVADELGPEPALGDGDDDQDAQLGPSIIQRPLDLNGNHPARVKTAHPGRVELPGRDHLGGRSQKPRAGSCMADTEYAFEGGYPTPATVQRAYDGADLDCRSPRLRRS
jgi:single-stranded DNA-binding protein